MRSAHGRRAGPNWNVTYSSDPVLAMSTVIGVLLYCGFIIWKGYADKRLRRMIEEERARYIGNLVKLEERITAIEQRIDGSPFIPPKPKHDE